MHRQAIFVLAGAVTLAASIPAQAWWWQELVNAATKGAAVLEKAAPKVAGELEKTAPKATHAFTESEAVKAWTKVEGGKSASEATGGKGAEVFEAIHHGTHIVDAAHKAFSNDEQQEEKGIAVGSCNWPPSDAR